MAMTEIRVWFAHYMTPARSARLEKRGRALVRSL